MKKRDNIELWLAENESITTPLMYVSVDSGITYWEGNNMEENKENYVFKPIINGLQKMILYKTRTNFYLIGSNVDQSKFRILKIDRQDPKELRIIDDRVFYTQAEIKNVIKMIDEGNKARSHPGMSGGASRSQSAFGILGFIRFMEGYYMVLITKRCKVGVIGHHSIYKIEDTSIVYIPHEAIRRAHVDEEKYIKLFNSIDLTSNFYFSYTYDLTNSLQYNMAPFNNIEKHLKDPKEGDTYMNPVRNSKLGVPIEKDNYVGYRNEPCSKFVWNDYLIQPMKHQADASWILPVIHGFMQQSVLSVYGVPLQLTLMARRSAKYAGTRFLKRGANSEGDVANEVETEQIVYDYHSSCFTSFVQIRGSIPLHWSQDISKLVAKPPIIIDMRDPQAHTPAKHLNKLFRRFGSPILAFNLVKRREKRSHEKILYTEFVASINQLNSTLPPSHLIHHVPLDMAMINKSKDKSVIGRLSTISNRMIKKTGFFCSKSPPYALHLNKNKDFLQMEHTRRDGDKTFGRPWYEHGKRGRLQTGVIRVNCVDCLDRTNTAQYILGKCALGYQLYSLGVLSKPYIEFDSVCCQILEWMYEDQGDTLALQYGGSQLVHRIETYRESARWTTQGRDLMQSVQRYYSNTYSDQDKQKSINLFLGVEVPRNKTSKRTNTSCIHKKSTLWWDDDVSKCLPYPADEVLKKPAFATLLPSDHPMIDLHSDFYRVEYVSFHNYYLLNIPNSLRDFVQGSQTPSPFVVQKRNRSASIEYNITEKKTLMLFSLPKDSKNISCASSTASSTSGTDTDRSDEELVPINTIPVLMTHDPITRMPSSFDAIFPDPEESYGQFFSDISPDDQKLYQRFCILGLIESQRYECPENLESLLENLVPTCEVDDNGLYMPEDLEKTCSLDHNGWIDQDTFDMYNNYASFDCVF